MDRTYRTLPRRAHRGVMGKSSGGYGALALAMRHPDVFGAVASHSGDMYFDYCYRPDIPRAIDLYRAAGGVEAWLRAFEAAPRKTTEHLHGLDVHVPSVTVHNVAARSEVFAVVLRHYYRRRQGDPTSSRRVGGLGLGLSGAKRLSNDFQIDSRAGEGTRVSIVRWR